MAVVLIHVVCIMDRPVTDPTGYNLSVEALDQWVYGQSENP